MKKLVSIILALAVALSLTGAAFAEEPVTITYATFSASRRAGRDAEKDGRGL